MTQTSETEQREWALRESMLGFGLAITARILVTRSHVARLLVLNKRLTPWRLPAERRDVLRLADSWADAGRLASGDLAIRAPWRSAEMEMRD